MCCKWFRLITFDLQIASVFLNGSCHLLTRGNVTLSYRIGSDDHWETIGEYTSNGKHNVCSVEFNMLLYKINKNLKFKKGVGITIKSKETSGKLATQL